MKNTVIILFIIFLFSLKAFSQKRENDTREVKEIKLILKSITTKEMNLPIYIEPDGLILPAYFTSYKKFIERLKTDDLDSSFLDFQILNKSDQKQLNYALINDTVKLYLQKEWFLNDKIKILSDLETNDKTNDYRKFIKPIFYRNYTRCYFACFNNATIDVFFFKKVNNHWINDNKMYRTVEY